MVCRREAVLNAHYLKYVDKNLGPEATLVVWDEYCRCTINKESGFHKILIHFHCRYNFHRYEISHVTELVIDHQELFVASLRFDEHSKSVHTH